MPEDARTAPPAASHKEAVPLSCGRNRLRREHDPLAMALTCGTLVIDVYQSGKGDITEEMPGGMIAAIAGGLLFIEITVKNMK